MVWLIVVVVLAVLMVALWAIRKLGHSDEDGRNVAAGIVMGRMVRTGV